MKLQNLFAWAMAVLLMAACKEGGNTLMTPVASGRPYEMLVVMDDSLWNRPAGRALFEALDTDVPGLPQSERSFRIMQIQKRDFDRNFALFRNIITPEISKIYSQPKFKFTRDVHAAPQIVMTIQAPSEEAFAEYVREHKQTIVNFFTRSEMNRQVKLLEKTYSPLVKELVEKEFGCDVRMPEELGNYKLGKNFFWATTNRERDDLNFVIYTYPFTDKNTFTLDYFVHKRDSFMKANLFGPNEGSYMATDTSYLVSKDIAVRGKYAQEVKGLWEMEGAVMGGPFVSHVRVDEKNGRVIVSEGFVYSPGRKKRDIMRRMEAALYTLVLPDEQTTQVETEAPVEGVEEVEE